MQQTKPAFPTIDLRRLTDRGPERQAQLDELRAIAHDFGAFSLIGHGVGETVVADVLAASRSFFTLPETQLARIAMTESPHFRGYTRLGHERTKGRADWREQIDVGPEMPPHRFADGDPAYWLLNGPNLWPDDLPGFRPVILTWMERLRGVASTLLGALTESLGLSADYFTGAFENDPHTHLKVIRYPGGEAGAGQGVGAHKDYGFLTLVLQDHVGGLQFLHDGEFVDVPSRTDAFVVNLGELLEAATSGYLMATTHRVVSPPGGMERVSVAYFYNPRLDYVVGRIPLPPGLIGPPETTDPENPIFAEYGRNALKGWLRAHPTVAQRHHAALLAV
jgi:isopenicillin N synthase-like dioxygenase